MVLVEARQLDAMSVIVMKKAKASPTVYRSTDAIHSISTGGLLAMLLALGVSDSGMAARVMTRGSWGIRGMGRRGYMGSESISLQSSSTTLL